MNIFIPDELLRDVVMTGDEIMFGLAMGLYIDQRLTLGQAAALSSMSKPQFLRELGQRNVPVHYDDEDLRGDLETISNLRDKTA